MLLDTDHYAKGEHLKYFTRALKEAQEKDVHVALSKPCFEFWLLLHYLTQENPDLKKLSTARHTEKLLQRTIGSYDKSNLKSESFPLKNVIQAIVESKAIDATVGGGDIPNANTSRVYQIMGIDYPQCIARTAAPKNCKT